MIQQLKKLAYRLSRKTEKQTENDGFLSYAGEWHSLTLGLSVGGSSAITGTPEIAATVAMVALGYKGASAMPNVGKKKEKASVVGEIQREPWYATGGVVLGFVGGLLISHM
ncbi:MULTISPECIES: hypothetical protein [Salinibaculum]|uniref:hypothetical protein n=1 Tax=Salinibaculum TaxID=2732368 RepID=UPI0030D3CE81